jgi:hypothetical protein
MIEVASSAFAFFNPFPMVAKLEDIPRLSWDAYNFQKIKRTKRQGIC